MTLRIRFICEQEAADDREVTADAQPGETIAQVAYRSGVLIQQTCGGTPSCADCRVIVKEGGAESLEPMEHPEKALLGNVFFITKERLACQAVVKKSATFWVPNPKKIKSTRKK
ncbi:MAG: 2Fe-2S iron-sulfur cluster-binding protein [Bdellovibrionota bacterium]